MTRYRVAFCVADRLALGREGLSRWTSARPGGLSRARRAGSGTTQWRRVGMGSARKIADEAERIFGPDHPASATARSWARRIRGAAAFDVLETFMERWNDFHRANSLTEKSPLVGKSVSLERQGNPGRLHVQVARTFGNGTAQSMLVGPQPRPPLQQSPYDFAKLGKQRSVRCFFALSRPPGASSTSRTSTS